MALNKVSRIVTQKDIDRIFKEGSRFQTPSLKFFYTQTDLPHSRFTPIISKKTAKLSTSRNRVKRVLAELMRDVFNSGELKYNLDVLALVKSVPSDDHDDYAKEIMIWLKKL